MGPRPAIFLLVACALICAGAVELMKTKAGQRVVIDVYPRDIVRVRLYPANDIGYEVTDVVVADALETGFKTACADASTCTVGTEHAQVKVTDDTTDRYALLVEWTTSDGTVAKAELRYKEGDRAEGRVVFPHGQKLYGIPERAINLALQAGSTYRLMNLDVFQYALDSTGGIYGTIPFLLAHAAAQSSGMLWLNSADTNVGIESPPEGGVAAQWSSEAGMIDVMVFIGPTPAEVQTQHSSITGAMFMPPQFALGYHQCRWNYRSTTDSLDVDAGFDLNNIPYDVLWLDIEHTDGKRYFTWDLHNFPEPEKLVSALTAKGRKLVTITDPHIKVDSGYHVYQQGQDKGFFVKTEAGSAFEGHCWPGTSSWVDFYNKNARDWYANLFHYSSYKGSSPDVYTWIDMNEPSVFNAPEVTMDKNAVHTSADGKKVKHRLLHNMYGFYHTMAAFQGHIVRNQEPPRQVTRPFILTRSFFAGSQRFAAMWTGDNKAEWGHLSKSIPMLLALSLSNYPFVGADVGGFFNNPEADLLIRWYQTAIFYPFFRAHAHLETKRREPWLFGDEVTDRIRNAIALRYSLIPYLYTLFYKAHRDGTNIIRPLFFEWPTHSSLQEQQESFTVGSSILVRPVTAKDATSVQVALPDGETWYEYPSGTVRTGPTYDMPVTMDTIPMFLRGGHIIPTKERLRRSTVAMREDPITLHVAVNAQGNSYGELYLDDTMSYAYQSGNFILKAYTFTSNKLSSKDVAAVPTRTFTTSATIERVVLYGESLRKPAAVYAVYNNNADRTAIGVKKLLAFSMVGNTLVIRKPDLKVDSDWTIALEY